MKSLSSFTRVKSSLLTGALLCVGPIALAGGCGDDAGPAGDGTDGGTADTGSTQGGSDDVADTTLDDTAGTDGTAGTADTTATAGSESSTGAVAHSAFEQAVEAIGGADALADLALLQIDATGNRRIDYEAPVPGGAMDLSSYTASYIFDVPNDNFRLDADRTPLFEAFQFGAPETFSIVLNGDIGGIDTQAGFYFPGPLASQNVAALQVQQRLFNPHFYLREGLADPTLIGDGGVAQYNERSHRVITFAGEVAEVRLLVDDETGFISKLETLENSVLVRDIAIEVLYEDWQLQGPLAFPDGVELVAGGTSVHDEIRTAVVVEPELDAETFTLPPEADGAALDADAYAFGQHSHQVLTGFFTLGFPYDAEPGLLPTSGIAPGVTLLPSSANTLVVSYDQGLVVVEAPATPAHGTAIVEYIEGTFVGDDITHVVQSHHHQDHAAGVRSLVAAGAIAVVGNGVADFWDEVFLAESTIRPDALADSKLIPEIVELSLDGASIIAEDGNVTVTVHHVSANPHADDMVITVVEADSQVFVYEADLYNAGFGFTLVVGGPQALFDALRDLNLITAGCTSSGDPLTIIPAHGVPLSIGDAVTELDGLGVDVGCGT